MNAIEPVVKPMFKMIEIFIRDRPEPLRLYLPAGYDVGEIYTSLTDAESPLFWVKDAMNGNRTLINIDDVQFIREGGDASRLN